MYHYTFGGLRNVYLENGYEIRKTPFGEAASFVDGQGLEAAICAGLVEKAARLTGAEFRFIRNGLLMSQPALARLIGIDAQSVARWEKTGKVPRWADRLVRLIYAGKVQGNVPIARAIERLQVVEQLTRQTLVMHERRGTWKPQLRDERQEAADCAA